jgi:hypothetical protein
VQALEGKGAAVFCELDAFDARRCEHSCSRANGAREENLQRPLFGAVAAAVTAETRPEAISGIDAGWTRGPTKGTGAIEENVVVGRMGIVGHGARVDLMLDTLEHGSEISGRHSFHTVPHGPFVEHPLGRSEHDHPIDSRAAAERGALQQRNGEIVSGAKTAIGVQAFVQLGLPLREILSTQRLTFLEDEHVVSGFGEACCRDGAASTRTHDDDLGAERRSATWQIPLPCSRRRTLNGGEPRASCNRLVISRISLERTLPIDFRTSQEIRAAIANLALCLRRGVLEKQDNPANRLHDALEGGDTGTGPAVEQTILFLRSKKVER